MAPQGRLLCARRSTVVADSFPNLPGRTGSREELVLFECPRPDVAVQEFSSDANFLFLVQMLFEIPTA